LKRAEHAKEFPTLKNLADRRGKMGALMAPKAPAAMIGQKRLAALHASGALPSKLLLVFPERDRLFDRT
jgi:hypothetical protein